MFHFGDRFFKNFRKSYLSTRKIIQKKVTVTSREKKMVDTNKKIKRTLLKYINSFLLINAQQNIAHFPKFETNNQNTEK